MKDTRPNILLLFPDQHRPDWVGWNPSLPVCTPHLDRLAAEGMRFDQAFTPSPLCAPARACLASGRDYARCGVADNLQDYPLDQPTFYQGLRDAGYRVAGVGKFDLHKDLRHKDWHLDGSRGLEAWGFTEGIDNEGKMDATASYRENGGRPKGPYMQFLQQRQLAGLHLEEHDRMAENGGAYTTRLPEDVYCDNWIADNGLGFLESFPDGQPWFLMVNFAGPHGPMDVTASMRRRWEHVSFPPPHAPGTFDASATLRKQQNYAAMIENIDRHVGRFLEQVDARGERERTLVVFSSDHGEMLGDHGRWGKTTWYHPSVHIPLVVAGPGVRSGAVSRALVSLEDLAATFLDYAGAEPVPGMTARSIRPALEGATDQHREVVTSALRNREAEPPVDWAMAWDGRYKLVREPGACRLYDLNDDPGEDCDIAPDRPDRVARLAKHLPPREVSA